MPDGSDIERRVIGFMSGTSMDAIDAALVRARGAGLAVRLELVDAASQPLGEERAVFRRAAAGEVLCLDELNEAIHVFSERHTQLAQTLIQTHGRVDLVCVHGQTLFHKPPRSWQAIEPWTIATATGAPVVFDLRAADLAAGGQGAPITPLADWLLFRSDSATRAIVNLGGFCNVTMLPAGGDPSTVRGFDVCACNLVLDAVARRALRQTFDEDGAAAMRGEVHAAATAELEDTLDEQKRQNRSLGTGDEAGRWIDAWIDRLSAEDLAASAAAGVGRVIGRVCSDADEIYLAGGGARNRALAQAIGRAARSTVRPLDALGVPGPWREAVAMAALGCLCADGVPITLPQVTGASAPRVAGSWVGVR